MGHDHTHGAGGSTAAAGYRGRLLAVLCITLAVLALELVVGLLSGSLALLADAAHLGTDALGIGREPTHRLRHPMPRRPAHRSRSRSSPSPSCPTWSTSRR